jgi:hypothetical protein
MHFYNELKLLPRYPQWCLPACAMLTLQERHRTMICTDANDDTSLTKFLAADEAGGSVLVVLPLHLRRCSSSNSSVPGNRSLGHLLPALGGGRRASAAAAALGPASAAAPFLWWHEALEPKAGVCVMRDDLDSRPTLRTSRSQTRKHSTPLTVQEVASEGESFSTSTSSRQLLTESRTHIIKT